MGSSSWITPSILVGRHLSAHWKHLGLLPGAWKIILIHQYDGVCKDLGSPGYKRGSPGAHYITVENFLTVSNYGL